MGSEDILCTNIRAALLDQISNHKLVLNQKWPLRLSGTVDDLYINPQFNEMFWRESEIGDDLSLSVILFIFSKHGDLLRPTIHLLQWEGCDHLINKFCSCPDFWEVTKKKILFFAGGHERRCCRSSYASLFRTLTICQLLMMAEYGGFKMLQPFALSLKEVVSYEMCRCMCMISACDCIVAFD